jgi:protein CpxP
MSVNRILFGACVALGSAALGLPLLVGAVAAPADSPDVGHCDARWHGAPPSRPPGPPMGMDVDRPPPFLQDLNLSEDQQDKVFAIVHAAAAALRDQSKAVHKAREALHELIKSTDFSEATATGLAQTQGKAEGQLSLLRTRMEHQVFAVLTAEQRGQVEQRQQEWESHSGGEGPPPRH